MSTPEYQRQLVAAILHCLKTTSYTLIPTLAKGDAIYVAIEKIAKLLNRATLKPPITHPKATPNIRISDHTSIPLPSPRV